VETVQKEKNTTSSKVARDQRKRAVPGREGGASTEGRVGLGEEISGLWRGNTVRKDSP